MRRRCAGGEREATLPTDERRTPASESERPTCDRTAVDALAGPPASLYEWLVIIPGSQRIRALFWLLL